eukprot:6489398-Prymnesium_polylepis.1
MLSTLRDDWKAIVRERLHKSPLAEQDAVILKSVKEKEEAVKEKEEQLNRIDTQPLEALQKR